MLNIRKIEAAIWCTLVVFVVLVLAVSVVIRQVPVRPVMANYAVSHEFSAICQAWAVDTNDD